VAHGKEMVMRIRFTLAIFVVALVASPLAAQEKVKEKPRVEVVFVLDTTGSMGGLIEGAKKKIWSIANTIARGKPTPDIHVGLVGYRDKGDKYVTKIIPLTDNLDKIYSDLNAFKAGGGGDSPENVRQALHEALTKMEWSRDKKTLKVMFLVGDAPPHLDYTDVDTVEDLCRRAAEREIIINTIRCGSHAGTEKIWQKIARSAEGKYFSISQTGGVVAVATPYDKELAELSDDMGRTVLLYGKAGETPAASKALADAEEMEDGRKADRAEALARKGSYSSDDLVDAVREKRISLDKVKESDLPEKLQKMSKEEREAFVKEKIGKRNELQEKILELSKKREQHIKEELKKKGVKDSFDQVVTEALREQAKKKSISIEE
jgi:Mg-chelatase subunit ChlD